MAQPESEPLSPELILVAPPEQARLARELLADPPEAEPPMDDPSEADWNEFLARVRNRQDERVASPNPPAPPSVPRKRSRRRLVAGVAVFVLAALAGFAWARNRGEQGPGSYTAPGTKQTAPGKLHAAAGFVPTRVWSWATVSGTTTYVVRFLRSGQVVLKVRTGGARLALPSGFSFRPGRYRWTVTTVARNGKPGRVVVDSSFVVPGSSG